MTLRNQRRILFAIMVAWIVVFALFARAFAQPAYPTQAYLSGCVAIEPTSEGFPRIYCPEDGASYYQDMDGQIYPNAAGNPVYAPGTWVQE